MIPKNLNSMTYMRYFLLSLTLLTLPMGCGQETATTDYAAEAAGMSTSNLVLEESAVEKTTADDAVETESKIIKTGIIRYEVKDLNQSFATLSQQIKAQGGYIQSDNSGNQYNFTYRYLSVRIPSKNFDKLLDNISQDVAYFDNKTITATDVTEEFIDVEARLANKKKLEHRYLELLAKTNQISEILEIEKSLSVIREEIESVQGRLNYLKNQVSFSTLTIEIYHTSATGSGITESYLSKMGHAVVSGFNSLSGFILGVLTLWPYVIITALVFVLIRKRIWKRRQQSQIDKEQ